MKLTRYTDYALRALIYLAGHDGGRVSIRQIAEAHGKTPAQVMLRSPSRKAMASGRSWAATWDRCGPCSGCGSLTMPP